MAGEKIIVKPDPDLAEESEWYLGQLKDYAKRVDEAVSANDFEAVQTIGHRVKGSAESFGFDGAAEIGRSLELAAKQKDAPAVKNAADGLSDYLQRVELVFD
jgi:HPt (histidine-containing phosphotransfer) domain-containing protein